MHGTLSKVVLAAAAALMILPSSQAAMLFGVQAGNPDLITIDSVTGAIDIVGPLPAGSSSEFDPVQGLTGAWLGRGVLLYTDGNQLDGVHQLDPTDGSLIGTSALPGVFDRGGLSYDSPTGSLFSINNGFPVVQQSGLGGAVDPVFAPMLPIFPGSLGGDDMGRHFAYGFCPEDVLEGIFEFDPTTGALLNHLPGPAPGPDLPVSGLAFDGQFLYLTGLFESTIYTLDPDSGAIVHAARYAGDPITALAHVPASGVPENGTSAVMALIGLAGVLLGGRRWKTPR